MGISIIGKLALLPLPSLLAAGTTTVHLSEMATPEASVLAEW